jgi:hypothetical protein
MDFRVSAEFGTVLACLSIPEKIRGNHGYRQYSCPQQGCLNLLSGSRQADSKVRQRGAREKKDGSACAYEPEPERAPKLVENEERQGAGIMREPSFEPFPNHPVFYG